MIVDSKKAKKRKRGIKKVVLNAHYSNYLTRFTNWLDYLGYATTTVTGYQRKLSYFFNYLQNNSVLTIYKITVLNIDNYNQALHKRNISRQYIQGHLNCIRIFGEYLEKTENYKLVYKAFNVEKELKTERTILSVKEIQLLFSSIEDTPTGLRDKALLHLYYSCGLRASEAARVRCKDIDYHKQLIYVAPGKNYKSRYVPIGTGVIKDLQSYEQYARPVINQNGNFFLVAPFTNHISTQTLARYLKQRLKKSLVTKKISAHSLRHSIATHLLLQGMDLELIQQFLGHRSLDATEIYVRMKNEYIYES